MKTWLPGCLLCVVVMVSGCRSTAKSGPEIASMPPVPEAPVATQVSRSFLEMPELQTGTGPMDSGAPPVFLTTDSGLKYRILRKSDGKKPTAADTVSVHYRGWLNSGKVFDSSYERGSTTTFPLENVIAGWTEGMQLVGEGGMIELYVPSRLGYGKSGSPGSIPPHSNLHFIVELVDVQ